MGRLRNLLPLLLLAPLVGCGSGVPIERWAKAHGGTLCDARLTRARGLGGALLNGRQDLPLDVRVLDRDDLSAFSWPGGQIFLSRGLVDALDDPALSAAIAHEMGHILNHRQPAEVSTLRGGESSLATEMHADRVGVNLLAASGLPQHAMARMLEEVVRHGNLSRRAQANLRRRVELLNRTAEAD